MKTRIYHTKTWKDNWYSSLSKDAKHLWNYLLLNEKINISGIYELTDREIVFDTSIDAVSLEALKKELHPKAIFFNGWVRIPNVDRYNNYRNSPKNEIAFVKEMSYVSDEVASGLGLHTSIDTSIYTPRNKKSETLTTKLEIKNQKSAGEAKFQKIGEILHKKDGDVDKKD